MDEKYGCCYGCGKDLHLLDESSSYGYGTDRQSECCGKGSGVFCVDAQDTKIYIFNCTHGCLDYGEDGAGCYDESLRLTVGEER